MTSLRARSWRSLLVLGVIMSAVLFGGAGTLRYWQSWIYLILFFGLATALTRDLLRRDPALLERRLKGGPTAETRPLQRLLMTGATVGFAGLLVIPALDVRWGRASVPAAGVVLGDVLFVAGFAFAGRVYRENTYASATIGVSEGQRVISTGPYAIVRHPLYASMPPRSST